LSDKTEEPTPRRLKQAEEEGDSGASSVAAQSVAFLVAVTLVPGAVVALAAASAEMLRDGLAHAAERSPGVFDPVPFAFRAATLSTPLLLAAGVAGAVASAVQTGGAVATKKLVPKLERLDPFEGVKQLFSSARLFAVARALVSGGAVGWLAWRALRSHVVDLAHLPGRLPYVGVVAGTLAGALCRDAAILGLALGAADLVVTRWQWRKRLRMSKDEVKREHKEQEGDPHVKAARERAHHEMLAAATVGNVKHASVVVVNPTHLAAALRYDEEGGDEAPVVVASGEGDLAKRIVEAAQAYGVPVLRDVPLARALLELEVGQPIPEALYEAVAEILREAWGERPPGTETPSP
jgi:flagellar biosynthesis protein FlhB